MTADNGKGTTAGLQLGTTVHVNAAWARNDILFVKSLKPADGDESPPVTDVKHPLRAGPPFIRPARRKVERPGPAQDPRSLPAPLDDERPRWFAERRASAPPVRGKGSLGQPGPLGNAGACLAGAEGGGATRRSPETARGREKVRQAVPGGPGWNTRRTWPKGRFGNQGEAIERLHGQPGEIPVAGRADPAREEPHDAESGNMPRAPASPARPEPATGTGARRRGP